MTKRTGLIAQKSGMTRIFAEDGSSIPVTVLQIQECVVVDVRLPEKHGYAAVVVGANTRSRHKHNRPAVGYFKKLGVEPRGYLVEFRVEVENILSVNTPLTPDHFAIGQLVDVVGQSKGKGFAGGMKRWNFGGLRASHGVSVSHRSIGSTGNRQDPGKVFKNKKMPGHLGVERVTVQNLEVVQIDVELGLLFVKGAVPGNVGSLIHVSDAVKCQRPTENK